MKKTSFLPKVLVLAFLASTTLPASAVTVLAPEYGYGVQDYYAHTTSDALISYDWDAASNLYYMTSAGFPDTNVWKATGGAPLNIYAKPANFAGASVVGIGDYVYFNDSNTSGTQFIRRYGPVSGSPVVTQTSTAPNYGLYTHGSELFVTGAVGFGSNHIYHSNLAPDGSLLNSPPTDLGDTAGGSGPLTFDLEGNLYFAPGFSDRSIYKWSAAELAAAIADPLTNPLVTAGHLWIDYSAIYGTVSGATSMLLDGEGDLLVTLTSFSDPSLLVQFGVDPIGAYNGAHTAILSDTGLLGELRSHDGGIFVSAGNEIFQVIPEPSTLGFVLALTAPLFRRRRRS